MMTAARVARAFDAAADYDAHAVVQRQVAAWLADALAAAAPRGARVLEIGCGTGFVAAAAAGRMAPADWLMTDVAPAMLARARARMAGRPGFRTAPLDGERPRLPDEAPFDIVCGSLAAQWFADLPAAIAAQRRLLRPGGTLLLTTLAAGTFAEWRAAHAAEGLVAGTPDYPDAAALAATGATTVERRIFVERHADARAFLRALRAIGAGTPRPGHRPLDAAALRRVARRFEAAGAVARYEVALLRCDGAGA